MLQDIILAKDDISSIKINPSKTIFWIGAGVGANEPCGLPLGNELTDTYLRAALGDAVAEQFILYWNNHIPRIRDCVRAGNWYAPKAAETYTIDDVRSGQAWERPRLEFIIGEINKLDQEFQGIRFQKPENQKRYSRRSSINAIRHFAEATPNLLHHWLADFAKAGSMIVTANFDTCIERALLGDAIPAPTSREGVRGIETGAGFIYHFHGVATDRNIQQNLGATINNVSKSLPLEFTAKLKKCFKDGYDIIFMGYSGLDFFDVRPFFEGLADAAYPGRALYFHFCKNEEKCNKAKEEENKQYLYLLEPFAEKKIIYGDSLDFFTVLGKNSSVKCTQDASSISAVCDNAFIRTKKELESITSCMSDTDRETYYFLNAFRLTSQLNINPANFYSDWGKRIYNIYLDWKEDTKESAVLYEMFQTRNQINESIVEDIRYNNWASSEPAYLMTVQDINPLTSQWIGPHETQLTKYLTWKRRRASKTLLNSYVEKTCAILDKGAFTARTPEEEDIERDTVHYLCGWQMKKLYALWAVPIIRYAVYPELKYHLKCIEQILAHPFTSLRYRTYYLSLCRQRDAILAMLGDKKTDVNGYYGDLQQEWNICMEIPDFYDARLVIRARMLQFWIMIFKGKLRRVSKYKELKMIYCELQKLRADIGKRAEDK